VAKADPKLLTFIDDSSRDQTKLIGRLNYWYNHGCEDSALTPAEKKFIDMVEEAHRMLTNSKNLTSRNTIIGKIKSLYGLTATNQVHFVIQTADALYNTERSWDKRYRKAMLSEILHRKIEECDTAKDSKNMLKFIREYKELHKLTDPIDDSDNNIITKTIELSSDPKLLESYDVEDHAKKLKAIERFESKAKAELYGE